MAKKTISMAVDELTNTNTADKLREVVDEIDGVLSISVNSDIGVVQIDYDDSGTSSSEIANTIMDMGYTVTNTIY